MAEKGTTGHLLLKMLLVSVFLIFLIVIAIPSPIIYDDIVGWGGTVLNFLAFIKSFLIGRPQKWSSITGAKSKMIPSYNPDAAPFILGKNKLLK